MDNGITSYELIQQRHRELVQEAESYWRSRHIHAAQESRSPIYAPALAALGRTFIAWGEALQPQAIKTETSTAGTR
jgi:hypothetical protein